MRAGRLQSLSGNGYSAVFVKHLGPHRLNQQRLLASRIMTSDNQPLFAGPNVNLFCHSASDKVGVASRPPRCWRIGAGRARQATGKRQHRVEFADCQNPPRPIARQARDAGKTMCYKWAAMSDEKTIKSIVRDVATTILGRAYIDEVIKEAIDSEGHEALQITIVLTPGSSDSLKGSAFLDTANPRPPAKTGRTALSIRKVRRPKRIGKKCHRSILSTYSNRRSS
jgi:hypothetical protein